MDSARWHRVDELFRQGLEVEVSRRQDWLDSVCGEDEALRSSLVNLLEHDDGAGDLLEAALQAGARDFVDGEQLSLIGTTIGPWRIENRLGSGGMSVVYRASRADRHFEKQVALKLIKPGLDSEDVLRRFENERRILATVDHPNVGRILDAGTTRDGLPFFVMELVDGLPVDVYCDQQNLSINDRIALFLQVLEALAAAHRNLIIHRDVKPTNILVTKDGTPKLLDFGIAKVLAPDALSGGEATALPHRPMTLSYASPEQMAGRPMTTASDVYSLGVLLYELLCGRRPFSSRGVPAWELEERLRQTAPLRPSLALDSPQPTDEALRTTDGPPPSAEVLARRRGVAPRQLRRQLEGDLDIVVLKAMRFEPDRRYPSPEHFADDLRRYLGGWPVEARADSLRYRWGKFVRRHRLGVATAAATVLLILAFMTALAVFSLRLSREKEVADQERRAAEQVSEFMIDIFHSVEVGSPPSQIRRAERLLDAESARVSEELEDQPQLQATMMYALGRIYIGLGLYDRAKPLMERSLALRRKTLGPKHSAVLASLDRLAILSAESGDYAYSESLFRESLALRRQRHKPPHPGISANLNNLGLVLHDQGRYLAAEPFYREALAMDEAVLGRHHVRTGPDLLNLGLLLYDLGSYQEARGILEEAVAVYRKHEGIQSSNLAESLRILGSILSALGEDSAASETLEEAASFYQSLLGERHPYLARARYSLALHRQTQGLWLEALDLHRQALEQRLELLGEDHPEVATSRAGLGEALAAVGRAEEAEASYVEALAIHRGTLPPLHSELGTTLTGLARLRLKRGVDGAEVRPLLEEARTILQSSLLPGDPRIDAVLELLDQSPSTGDRV